MRKMTIPALLLAGVSPVILAAPAFAQEEVSQGGLAEIVVTAQKRSENLQDVPIAVTALAGAELQGASIDGQMMLPKVTPNLNFTVVASFSSAYIRGVGTQFANPGLESSVSVYFDDVYVPRAFAGMLSFSDIEQIEVLKGPQGTLYGRNATGGAIRIITADPKDEFGGNVQGAYGTDNRMLIEGAVNIPFSDKFKLRIAAHHDENDGYMRNTARTQRPGFVQKKAQSRNQEMFTAKLLMEPTENLTVKIWGDYIQKNDPEGNAFQNLWAGAPGQIGIQGSGLEQIGLLSGGQGASSFYDLKNDGWMYNNIYSHSVNGRIDYDLGAATVSSITSTRRWHERNCADLDGTDAPIQDSCGKPFTRQFTQELQVTSNTDGPLKYVAGVYYLHEESGYDFSVSGAAIDGGFGPTATALGLNPVGVVFQSKDSLVKVNSFAPYVQLDYEITDQFAVTLGLRYTTEKKKLISNSGGLANIQADGFDLPGTYIGGIAGPCTAGGQVLCVAPPDTNKYNKLTPKLTLTYRPNDDLMLYLTASRGVKSGGFNLPAFGAVDQVNPETLDSLEFGWKYQAGNVRFNGAAFYYDYQDLQIQITDQTTGGTRVKNAAAAEVIGLEADLTWAATDQFEFAAGAGFLDTKYKNFIGDAYRSNFSLNQASCTANPAQALCTGVTLTGGNNLSGNTMVNAPKFSGNIRGTFTQPLDGMGEIVATAILTYRTKAYFDVANLFLDKSRALLSGRIQWNSEDAKYFVAVSGENLTGNKYYVGRPAQATGGWQTPAPPRQVYVHGGFKF